MIAALLVGPFARSAPLRFGPNDVASLFTVSKSENKNQVVYAIHLDAQCAPLGEAPVFAYWRMNEKGPDAIEPLLAVEEKAYGIERQRIVSSGGAGAKMEVALKAMPSRPIVIDTAMRAGSCKAWSTMPIAGETSFLYDVYVKLIGPRVEYLVISGWSADRSRVVHERLTR